MALGLNAFLAAAQGWRRPFLMAVLALAWGTALQSQPGAALPRSEAGQPANTSNPSPAPNQAPTRQAIPTGLVSIESDLQKADQATGVITATGNVRILYPDRGVMATARQAQYFSREGRVVLSGDVDVVQQDGSLLRAEQVTYLVRSQRLTALPATNQQVLSRLRLTPTAKPAAELANPGPASSTGANRPATPGVAP